MTPEGLSRSPIVTLRTGVRQNIAKTRTSHTTYSGIYSSCQMFTSRGGCLPGIVVVLYDCPPLVAAWDSEPTEHHVYCVRNLHILPNRPHSLHKLERTVIPVLNYLTTVPLKTYGRGLQHGIRVPQGVRRGYLTGYVKLNIYTYISAALKTRHASICESWH
jgi:hypothetical protein